jgi:hypothetical protein
VPAAVQAPKEQELERRAYDGKKKRSHHQREPEVVGGPHDRVCDVRADHIEGPVREVEHVHQAEDDRQAGGQQEHQAAESQPADD